MYKKLLYALRALIKRFAGPLISILVKREPNIWAFGSFAGEAFFYNAKYLYLFLNNNKPEQIKLVWITKNKDILKKLREKGYKVCHKYSFKGFYYILKAKYYFIDCKLFDISRTFSYGATVINMWHGIPLKKIEADIDSGKLKDWQKYNFFEEFFVKSLDNQYDHYFISNGDFDKKNLTSAFKADPGKVVSLGSPRNDVLFRDFKDQDIFMEEDTGEIKKCKQEGKKLIFYIPTFRDTGRNATDWLNSEALKETLDRNNAVLFFKLHPKDQNIINYEEEFLYELSGKADLYCVLKEMDVLITDYSSVYFDYLLLDRPIIFYCNDLEQYTSEDRPLYVNYNDYTPGIKAYNESELMDAINKTLSGTDNYKNARAKLRNEIFLHQDGNSCERVVEFVKSLGSGTT